MKDHPLVEVLSGYIDGQVSPEEGRQVEAHLVECASCRDALAGLRHTVALVAGLEPVGAPPGFRAEVVATLAGDRPRAGSLRAALTRGWPARLRRPNWRTALATAAVLAIGLFSVNLLGQFARETRQQPSAARDAGERESLRALEGVDRPNGRPVAGVQPVGVGVPQAQAPGGPGINRLPLERQIVRSATLELEVAILRDSSSALISIADSAGGFVSVSPLSPAEPPSGTVLLRIPTFRFTEALEQIEALGTVTGRQVRGEDVTEESVDLRVRIRDLQTQERQLLTVMDRATRVQDLRASEQELSRVRGEIEQVTGRLRLLANRVQMSTIQVTLREKAKQ